MVQVMKPIKASIDMDALLGTAKELGPLSKQFHGYTGGPAEASERALGVRREQAPQPQGQLFNPEHIPAQQPHQQLPHEFAEDPRTWWHGRVMSESPRSRLPSKAAGRDEGFHAGSQAAARQRVTYNIKRRGLKEGKVGRMFPLRITGSVRPPEELQPDMMRHRELGSWGLHGGSGYLYKNAVEGGEGEVSLGVPSRGGYLSTHKEMVMDAEKRGQSVHPNISWAVRHGPEHTGEAIREHGSYRLPRNTPQQMGLHEQFEAGNARGEGADPQRAKSFLELHPERTRVHRTTYDTMSGRRKHAWAFSTELPGSALMSKQWSPGNS